MESFQPDRPDWEPLEKALPLEQCAGFMFMGIDRGIRMYKHGFTRHYLLLDADANAYLYVDRTRSYVPVPLDDAIERVFEGLEEVGVTREDPFDDAARERRLKALAEAGWHVVSVDPSDPP